LKKFCERLQVRRDVAKNGKHERDRLLFTPKSAAK